MIYTQLNAPLRTNEKFRSGCYGSYHKHDSIITELPIDVVKDFVVADCLHILDLGEYNNFVMKQ